MNRWRWTLAWFLVFSCLVNRPALAQPEAFDLQLSFPAVGGTGNLINIGAEFDGTFFYTTRALTNLIHRFDRTGVPVDSFVIAGITDLKDLAFDGTYMYAGNGTGSKIYQMDFVGRTAEDSIDLVQYPVRSIAYDPGPDRFWIGMDTNLNPQTDLLLVDRAGIVRATIPFTVHNVNNIKGLAFDGWSDGGPYLWAFERGTAGALQRIHQIHLPEGSPTGVVMTVDLVDNDLAGGLFAAEGVVPGTVSLGGLIQGSPNMVFAYELASVPTVSTLPPTGVTTTSALLHGTVNPNGLLTNGWFEWGRQPDLSDATATTLQTLGSDSISVTIDHVLTGLLPSTRYYFRTVASNAVGTQQGDTLSFETAPIAPATTTQSAIGITGNGAVLRGRVNPNGDATTAWFRWGTDLNLSNMTPMSSIGSGTTFVPISSTLTGLNPNTTYYVAAVGQNGGGQSFGDTLSFFTSANLPTVTTDSSSMVSQSRATVHGTVNPNGLPTTTGWFEWGTDPDLLQFDSTPPQAITGIMSINAPLASLTSSTIYYFRTVAMSGGTQRGVILSFQTDAVVPTVTTQPASNITGTGATLNALINPNGDSTTAWFRWGSTPSMPNSTQPQEIGSGTVFVGASANLSGLSNNTIYYFLAVGENGGGQTSGDTLTFGTDPEPPTVTTQAASNIAGTSATLNALVNPRGDNTTVWFRWGTDPNMVVYDSTVTQSVGSGTMDVSVPAPLVGLSPNMTYYFLAVGLNGGGLTLGSTLSFDTNPVPPAVGTQAPTGVNGTSATLRGRVNPRGDNATGWFRWGTDVNMVVYDSTAMQSVGSGTTFVPISSTLTGLNPNTTYYVAAVGQNGGGQSFGDTLSFFTSANLPTVTTDSSSMVSQSRATVHGTVNPNGLPTTTGWFEWGTDPDLLQFDSTPPQAITGIMSINAPLASLTSSTIYYFRTVAMSGGTQRGVILSFQTDAVVPTVTTQPASNITGTGATLNALVNPNGDNTTAWFRWGTDPAMVVYDSTAMQSAGSGVVDVPISAALPALSPNTRYYFLAAGLNGGGLNLGSTLSFDTNPIPPIVGTQAPTGVTETSAILNGLVNPNGDNATAWFRWGTDVTLSNMTPPVSIGAGVELLPISSALTGLNPNATYYFAAVGQNGGGQTFGDTLSFFTSPNLPIVSTDSSSLVGQTSASLFGAVNPNGIPTDGWFEWGTDPALVSYDSTSVQAIGSDTSATILFADLIGLEPNTRYYFNAVGRNGAGVQHGVTLSLQTAPVAPVVSTLPAIEVTQSGATLRGSINPNNDSTLGWFRWGTDSMLTVYDSTLQQSAGGGTSFVDVAAGVESLQSSSRYFFQAVGMNGGGTVTGSVQSFLTLSNLPTVTTDSASMVSDSGAVLHATINPNGLPTSAWFEWGTDPKLSQFDTTTHQAVGTGTNPISFSRLVSTLQPDTVFYFSVVAQNSDGTQRGGIRSFQTGAVMIVPPVLVSPLNNAVNQDTALTLTWNPSMGARDYGVQLGTDSMFSVTLVNDSGLISTNRSVDGLSRGTIYYWRVNASDGVNTSPWSGSRNFTTLPTLEPPPADTTMAGSATEVRLVVPGNLGTLNDSLFYRRGGEISYVFAPMVRVADTLTGSIAAEYVTIRGIEYYISTTTTSGQNILVNTPGDPGIITVQTGAIQSPLDFERVSYKMISIPLGASSAGVDSILADDFGPYDRRLWRVFRWEQGVYNEHPQITSSFSPGSSFWLISHEGKGFDVEGGLSVNTDDPYPITLQPGWNQVASPFAFRVLWDTAAVQGVTLASSYDGMEYQMPTGVLEPWQGYFVQNGGSAPATMFIQPREVPPMMSKALAGLSLHDEQDFMLQLSASLTGSTFIDTHNYVGMVTGAESERDHFDFPEPPPIDDALRLSILDGENRFMRNAKPLSEEGQYWDLRLSAPAIGQVRIELSQSGTIPDRFQIYLLDKDRFTLVPTVENSLSVEIQKEGDVRTFRLIIGTQDFAAKNSEGIPLIPLEYALGQNFPNPFNPATTIRYQLSERTLVTLELYNILGQRVKTLVNEEQVTGMYSVVWEGDNDAGNRVGSGVYLYRLVANDFVATRKMLLLR